VTAARPIRRLLLGLAVLACGLSVMSLPQQADPVLSPAADTKSFQAGNIISDAVFYDSGAMSASQIQAFLASKGAACKPASGGPACLKDFVQATTTRAADSYCPGQYVGAPRETAAQIIAKVSIACGINPRVILVTLQKEMTLVTRSAPTAKTYTRAMGYACPDSTGGTCDSTYDGFFNQVYSAAKQFQRYRSKPTSYGYVAGRTNYIQYNPNTACGSSGVTIANQGTRALYIYTPYQPNAAALAAGYGASSDKCSSYGNRNFWLYFTDWFGSTQTVGRDADAPLGSLEAATGGPGTITVRGWTYDPNARTSPMAVHFYVDGAFSGALYTSEPRPDISATQPGVGPNQGYAGTIRAAAGVRTVCAYAINVGAGYTNNRIGCRTMTVLQPSLADPKGALDAVLVSGATVSTSGWAYDPDVPTEPVVMHVHVDGHAVAAVTADRPRSDIARKFPALGPDHGYLWTGTLTAGSHEVCTWAINVGAGTGNQRLGCKTVTIAGTAPASAPGSPVGSLDAVTVSGTTVGAHGWTFDPDDAAAVVTVQVYVDGRLASGTPADVPRSDIDRKFPGAGPNHGFNWFGTVTAGEHEVCAYAINVGTASANTRLGCKTVSLGAPPPELGSGPPRGTLDSVIASGTTVRANGWTFDPDAPTTAVTVHVYVDGRLANAVTANQARSDIARIFPAAGGAHGYSWVATLPRGSHQVCAYAINIGAGTGNPQLGCKSVTVA
jgi:hypothetical protein